MLAHVFPARGEMLGYSEPRKPKHLPFGKHVPVSDVVSAQRLVRRFACAPTRRIHSGQRSGKSWLIYGSRYKFNRVGGLMRGPCVRM